MAGVQPHAGLSGARQRLQAWGPCPRVWPSGLTCSCSSPSTCTVKTLPRLSRPEMASRDLDAASQGGVRAPLAVGPGPHPSTRGNTGQLCVCSSPSLSAGRTVQAWPPPPVAPAASTVPPRKAHSRVSMTQGLDADKHPHGVASPRPALRLPAVCGDRHACSSPPGRTEQRGAGARQPGAGPGAAKLEESEPSARAPAGGGDGGMSSRGPRPGGWPPLTHVQAGGELEDGGHRGCEPA